MKNELVLPFDPFKESKQFLLIIIFYRAKSQFFNRAASIAGGVQNYETLNEGDIHIVRFSKNMKDATSAYALITCLESWGKSGRMIFAGGRLLTDNRLIKTVIDCYIKSFSCTDLNAYCCKVEQYPYDRVCTTQYGFMYRVDMPKGQVIRLFFNPCKKLNLGGISKEHPSSLDTKIQARTVELEIDWCPNLDISKAQPINF